jgi:hypothetical protein
MKIRAEHDALVKQASKIKDKTEREEKLAELENEDTSGVCTFQRPVGWPIGEDDGDGGVEIIASGLPRLGLVMQVDIMGNFKYDREQSFQSSFGDLPARATFELTNMLYKTTTLTGANENLPRSIFMSEPEILSEFDRKQRFLPRENTLDAFYTAGYYGKQFTNVMNVIRNFPVASTKLDLYNEYMERAQHQFKSLALNGNLHSSHTQFAAGYIDRCNGTVCDDLRKLIDHVFSETDAEVFTSDDMEDQAFAEDLLSPTHWSIMCPSSFVAATWKFEVIAQPQGVAPQQPVLTLNVAQEMRRRYNHKFFLLTPQNMKICGDTALSSIMYRLGQHNGWTYIGMPTVVCDTACKLMVRQSNAGIFIPETRKKPSAGLDLCR